MNNSAKQHLFVWWVLWASFQMGIFVMYNFLRVPNDSPQHLAPDSLPWLLGIIPLCASIIIRWGILPRIQTAQAALPLQILGIAMAESTVFLGIFIFTPHQQELFILGALGIFQFIPLHARRFFADDTQPPVI